MNLKNKVLFFIILFFVSSYIFAKENSLADLPTIKKTEIVHLKDGDNYTLTT